MGTSQRDDMVRMEEIKPYLEQWDNNKKQIERLTTMEEDLSLLIQALSLQADIDTVPESMKDELVQVEHGSNQPQEMQQATQKNTMTENVNADTTVYGVQIGRYLVPQSAKSQMLRLKEQYPKLNEVIQYRIDQQQKQSVTFYNLIAGPLKNQLQAAKLCIFFNKIGNTCTLSSFSQNI
ncbi:hypothetical protein PA7559_15990 [Pseudoalteromonas distincta]